MKAVVSTRYGSPDVLQFKEVERPAPKDGEVLVKVYAASVNAADWHLLSGKPFLARLMGGGLLKPKSQIPGSDVAGRVEAVGSSVKEFQVGDEVFGAAHWGFAEYACAYGDLLVLKPANLSFEEAAAVPIAAITALQALRDQGRVQTGQKVLITGASGGVGTFAVQIAKSFGAEVTGVCSARNLDLVRSLGADHVIDYTREDFTEKELRYDLIVATAEYHSIFGYRTYFKSEWDLCLCRRFASDDLASAIRSIGTVGFKVREEENQVLSCENEQEGSALSEGAS